MHLHCSAREAIDQQAATVCYRRVKDRVQERIPDLSRTQSSLSPTHCHCAHDWQVRSMATKLGMLAAVCTRVSGTSSPRFLMARISSLLSNKDDLQMTKVLS